MTRNDTSGNTDDNAKQCESLRKEGSAEQREPENLRTGSWLDYLQGTHTPAGDLTLTLSLFICQMGSLIPASEAGCEAHM